MRLPIITGATLIALLNFAPPAMAETRGEAYLRALWKEMPQNSGMRQLGALNQVGLRQANQTLLSQGISWCRYAEQPYPVKSLGLNIYSQVTYSAQYPKDPVSWQTTATLLYAYRYLCPEYRNIYQQARNYAIQQGLAERTLKIFKL